VLPRFFAPDASSDGPSRDVQLSEEESRHAKSVLRLSAGDALAVFDGRGREWLARVVSLARSAVTVRLETPLLPAAEPRLQVILLQAVLKGDHMDAVVRDATMLGATEIHPVITANTVANAKAASGPAARARWLRVAIASAKQCRRAVVPVIMTAAPLEDVLKAAPVAGSDRRIVLAEPGAAGERRAPERGTPRSVAVAVGPEGGWSSDELSRFDSARFEFLTLGALTLRADAAALVAISVLRDRWGDL
jgi:16S rRNA (uracil1498-N3)-methyltransferase